MPAAVWRNLTIPERPMPKFYPIDKQAGNPCGPFSSFGLPGGAAAWRTPATKNTPNLRFGVFSKSLIGTVAVTVGFEPTLALTPNIISSDAPSAARTHHQQWNTIAHPQQESKKNHVRQPGVALFTAPFHRALFDTRHRSPG